MSYTQRFTEDNALLATYNADSQGVGTVVSAYVDMETYHRAVLLLNVGDMGALATLNVQLLQATSAAGAGAKTIADKAATGTKSITQLTQAGGDGNDNLGVELQTEELDVDGGFNFIAVQVVVAVAAVEMGWVLLGTNSRYKAVPTTNFAEIID